MLDYLKIWIWDRDQIEKVMKNRQIKIDRLTNEHGEVLQINGRYKGWQFTQTFAPYRLQITGSIHKYWNGGTNENDFSFTSAAAAIQSFCLEFDLSPSFAFVINLEFGLNLQLAINASEILEQVICFRSLEPLRPYQNVPDCYFMEFELWDYYLKLYDKGKQYRRQYPETPNTLRVEIKGMNSGYFTPMGISTLADLTPANLQVLGWKLAKTMKGLVFDDDTLQPKELPANDRKLYREWSNPKRWKKARGNKTSTIKNRESRFKFLVEQYGQRKIYSLFSGAIQEKLLQLSEEGKVSDFLPNTYTWKSAKKRVCKSCGRDISNQKAGSRFCSARFVGEEAAHQCRNMDSNRRNNRKRKIAKINSRGVLFDVEPYILNNGKIRANPKESK